MELIHIKTERQGVAKQNDSNLGTTSVSTEIIVESMLSTSDKEVADYVLTYFEANKGMLHSDLD